MVAVEQPYAYSKEMVDQDADFWADSAVKHYLDFWDNKKVSMLDKSRQFGVGAEEFFDPNCLQLVTCHKRSNLIEDWSTCRQ